MYVIYVAMVYVASREALVTSCSTALSRALCCVWCLHMSSWVQQGGSEACTGWIDNKRCSIGLCMCTCQKANCIESPLTLAGPLDSRELGIWLCCTHRIIS